MPGIDILLFCAVIGKDNFGSSALRKLCVALAETIRKFLGRSLNMRMEKLFVRNLWMSLVGGIDISQGLTYFSDRAARPHCPEKDIVCCSPSLL